MTQRHTRPLDLGQLDERLRQVSADGRDASARASSRIIERSRSPTVSLDGDAIAREKETDAYTALVKDGGRPLYPIDLLDEVFRHPDEHGELLRPWQENLCYSLSSWNINHSAHEPWEVFQRQWSRWRYFRAWQRDNRWLEDDDGGFPAYVELKKQVIARHYTRRAGIKLLAKIEADPLYLKDEWDWRQSNRQWQRDHWREFHGGVEFSGYVEAVSRRLARHGFTQPFQLQEDPKQQDKWATWIEYLNFEYWWLDRLTDIIERLMPKYNKAWQKLVDSKVLRLRETAESVRSDASLNRLQIEQDQALEAQQRAMAKAEQVYRSTQLDPDRLSIPQPERIRRINEARREMEKAQERLDSITNRTDRICDFVGDAVDLKVPKRDAALHRTLIPWILEQVPLIEAELKQTKAMISGSDKTKRTKRRLDSDDTSQQRAPKKQRLGHMDKGSAFSTKGKQTHHHQVSSPVVQELPSPQQEKLRKRNGAVPVQHPPRTAAHGLRRSACIAAAAIDRHNSTAALTCPKSSGPSQYGKTDPTTESPFSCAAHELRGVKKKKKVASSGDGRDSSKPEGVSKRARRRS